MGMKVEWECKNGHTNDPEDPNYSWLRCSECPAWRWDWLKWAAGGVLALAIVILGYFLKDLFFQKPEAIYKNNYKKYVLAEEKGKEKYTISPQGQKVLDDLAKRHKFPDDKVKNLVQEAQKEVLAKLIEENQTNPSEEKAQDIKDLAKRWDIDLTKLSEPKPHEPIKKPDEPVKKPDEPAKKPDSFPTDNAGAAKVRELLQEGKYAEARKELAMGGPGVDPEMDKLRQDMETPLGLVVNFQYQRPKSRPSEKIAIASPRLADLYLTPKDNYRMFIETHSPCYFYVFQTDAEGRVDRLFPNPFYNKTDNPVLPMLSLQIPFAHAEWLYLEEVGREAPPKKNTLYFLASPWPAKHLDELYGKLHQETNREARNEILKEFMAALDSWKTAGMPALFLQEFNFFQAAKVPPPGRPGKN
jgi:hypothetical protein